MKIPDTRDSNQPGIVKTRERVVNYFLNLYRLQLEELVTDEKHCEFNILPNQSGRLKLIYELRVKCHGGWKERRMTIVPLGDESSSKSKCFMVRYDDNLVVKIPPKPISNFDAYIASIDRERQVFDLLTPDVKCVTPSLTDILQRIPHFYNNENLSPENYKAWCIKILKRRTGLQHFLKIDGAFVFFMNLSETSFFSQELEKINKVNEHDIYEEMVHFIGSLLELGAFEKSYGKIHEAIFLDLNDIWISLKNDVDLFFKQNRISATVPEYRLKEWLRIKLAGGKVRESDTGLPANVMDALNLFLWKFIKDNRQTFENFRTMVRTRFRHERFKNNCTIIKGIITNILNLLYILKEKGVAARDLKPDNIFIAAYPNTTPSLPSAKTYSLGLIDMETSVNIHPTNKGPIKQPLLIGTPSYATPSHLFENEILENTLVDLPRIIFLQDWYAAIAMIYQTITGKRIFERTRGFLPEIVRMRAAAIKAKRPLVQVFENSSRIFWVNALKEFENNITDNMKRLQEEKLKIVLPERIKQMLRHEVLNAKHRLDHIIKARVFSQSIFRRDEIRRRLIESSHFTVSKNKKNWKNGVNVPKTSSAIRERVIRFLENLEKLKRESGILKGALILFEKEKTEVKINDLLEIMFIIVYRAMARQGWLESPFVKIFTDEKAVYTDDEAACLEKTLQ